MAEGVPRATRRERAAVLKERGVAFALRMLDIVPGLRRLLEEITRIEFIDRSLVIAAQALFSVTPLIVVVAAFSPRDVADHFLYQLSETMGISGSDANAIND